METLAKRRFVLFLVSQLASLLGAFGGFALFFWAMQTSSFWGEFGTIICMGIGIVFMYFSFYFLPVRAYKYKKQAKILRDGAKLTLKQSAYESLTMQEEQKLEEAQSLYEWLL